MKRKSFSEETAYQMDLNLEGAVERGTAKKLKDLKVPWEENRYYK